MGLELEINSESRTYLDNDEIEVRGSTITKNHFFRQEFVFQPHTNDEKNLRETFYCACLVRTKLTLFYVTCSAILILGQCRLV